MDQLTTVTALVSFVAGLSVATERITDTIKRLPYLSKLFSDERKGADGKADPKGEDLRVILVYVLAAVVGTVLCWQSQSALGQLLPIKESWPEYLLFGVLASGGSGFWNSALDFLRKIKKP